MRTLPAVLFLVLVGASSCFGLVMVQKVPELPADWPEEMRPLLPETTAYDMATGMQELTYEIRFKDRAQFEGVWPTITTLKSKGASLRLYRTEQQIAKTLFRACGQPSVLIMGPPPGRSAVRVRDGNDLQCGPPWPKSIFNADGTLPEYVAATNETWVPADLKNSTTCVVTFDGFLYRARVDIALVVDGHIIDLNRISLPENTPIIDCRKQGPATRPSDGTSSQPSD